MNHSQSRRRAFSLLELLVVMGIAALMAGIALGGFSSFQGSQRRSTCQSNMVQIYRACRLYENDYSSFPATYTFVGQTQLSGGLGLLWAQPDGTSGGTGLKPFTDSSSYLKSPNALHCPADAAKQVAQTAINSQGQVDLSYLSYQKMDAQGGDDSDGNINALYKNQTYLPNRTTAEADVDYARQLIHQKAGGTLVNIPTPSDTVVLWCPFHRGVSSKPDNVLFYDGSVRRMVIAQEASCSPSGLKRSGWRRLSQCKAAGSSNNEGAALAQP